MIVSQAPGTRVHETGLSFNDRSGDVLRAWLGIDRETFYDESRIAILPMGCCYPGRDKGGGDLPPRKECAPLWQARLRAAYPNIGLTVLAGSYAINWYLRRRTKPTMGETVKAWRELSAGIPAAAPSELAQRLLAAQESLVRERPRAGAAGAGTRAALRLHVALDPRHVVVAEAEMVADLMDQHVAHDMRQSSPVSHQ